MKISRQQFLRDMVVAGGAGAAALALRPFRLAAADADTFHVALIADTHIIDDFYKGPEAAGTPEDRSSVGASRPSSSSTIPSPCSIRPK